MNKGIKKIIEIECSSNEEKIKVGELINNQLVSNKDYIDNSIILNIDGDCKVRLTIFNECKK